MATDRSSRKLIESQSETGKQQPLRTEDRKKEIIKRLLALAAATRQELSPDTIDIYLQCLLKLDMDKLNSALESLVETSKFFPSIPEIRQLVVGNQEEKEAESQWHEIASHIDEWSSRLELEDDAYASGFSCGTAKFDISGLSEVARVALKRLGGPRAVAGTAPQFIPKFKETFVNEYRHICREHPHLKQIEGGEFSKLLKAMDSEEPKQ